MGRGGAERDRSRPSFRAVTPGRTRSRSGLTSLTLPRPPSVSLPTPPLTTQVFWSCLPHHPQEPPSCTIHNTRPCLAHDPPPQDFVLVHRAHHNPPPAPPLALAQCHRRAPVCTLRYAHCCMLYAHCFLLCGMRTSVCILRHGMHTAVCTLFYAPCGVRTSARCDCAHAFHPVTLPAFWSGYRRGLRAKELRHGGCGRGGQGALYRRYRHGSQASNRGMPVACLAYCMRARRCTAADSSTQAHSNPHSPRNPKL